MLPIGFMLGIGIATCIFIPFFLWCLCRSYELGRSDEKMEKKNKAETGESIVCPNCNKESMYNCGEVSYCILCGYKTVEKKQK